MTTQCGVGAWHAVGALRIIKHIPRGAVPMARIVADQLGGELDVVRVRKLRAPQQPELVIGPVDESGWTYLAVASLRG